MDHHARRHFLSSTFFGGIAALWGALTGPFCEKKDKALLPDDSSKTSWTYDSVGRPSIMLETLSDVRTTTYEYDNQGRVVRIEQT